ncbi:MAG: carboxymuconolactone decarboxylase family protein [Burkholderiaceae bacterium]
MDSSSDSAVSLAQKLESLREKRGFLLPHHGLMAITSPRLLDAYDTIYTVLALDERVLSLHDREFVWLAILIATDEAIATHHIAKFKQAGGTDAEISAIMALTAFTLGFESYRFVERHWMRHLPEIDTARIYLSSLQRCAVDVHPRLVHMAAAAVHTCRAAWDALRLQIVAAYDDGVPEQDLAEALSLCMFPGSVPHFVEAARVWRALVNEGRVAASPAFKTWASLSGQGGYDEAAGAATPAQD